MRHGVVAWVCGVCLALGALGVAASAMTAGLVDFSGNYKSQTKRGETAEVETLHVAQDATSIEIDRALEGETRTEKYSLDGTEAAVTNADGLAGMGHVRFMDGVMVVETLFAGKVDADMPVQKIHTVERWRLSADRRVLKIGAKTDFPGMSRKLSSVIDANSQTTYVRVEGP
jgi:hypothetical protein